MNEARTSRRGTAPGRPDPRPREPEPGGAAAGRRPHRWKAVCVALLVIGVLGTVAWVLLGSRLLVVRSVEVTGTELAPRDRIVATAGIRLGLPMVRLGTGSVEARLERLREVESATVERQWPATVRIVVRERVPVVAVERAGRYHQLDRYGVTVTDGPSRPPALPTLSAASPGPTDASTLAALKVIGELPGGLRTRLHGVEASSPDTVTLRLRDGLTVVWGAAGRSAEKVRLIDALRASPAGRDARTIDVSSPEFVTTR
ncbi:cell division protein FtsQ/DivIB [Actinomadura sp. 9N407]|uniref:cell division protein FtsQ/DivIB n=1 Tax=Actinomadura sp. 9N407 TaxID=3375154 RepID=UPI00379B029D